MQREKLIAARIKKGLSQEAAAELIGVSRNTFSQWELGNADPYPFNIGRLCEFFGAKDPAELDIVSTHPLTIRNIIKDVEQRQEFTSPLAQSPTPGLLDTISQLESAIEFNVPDPATRRMFSAAILSLPSASLIPDSHVESNDLTDAVRTLEESSFPIYEDVLIMGWECFRRSKDPLLIRKLDAYVDKLTKRTQLAPLSEKASWRSLLCRFCQLATRIAQHTLNEQKALSIAKQAIMIAIDLDDAELIASAFYGRGRVYIEYCNIVGDINLKQRYLTFAKADIDTALAYAERVRAPLAGNIYLIASELYARLSKSEAKRRIQCEIWQEQVASFVYGKNIENDGTFLKLNPTALHHERAKMLLQFGQIQEARDALNTAWETVQPNLPTWQVNMYLTEASLFIAERDIESSAKLGLKAYTLAKSVHSQKGEAEVKYLLSALQQHNTNASSVRALNGAVERSDI